MSNSIRELQVLYNHGMIRVFLQGITKYTLVNFAP